MSELKPNGKKKKKSGREKDEEVNRQSTRAPRKVKEKVKEAKAKERARSTKLMEDGATAHSTHFKDKLPGRSGDKNRRAKRCTSPSRRIRVTTQGASSAKCFPTIYIKSLTYYRVAHSRDQHLNVQYLASNFLTLCNVIHATNWFFL